MTEAMKAFYKQTNAKPLFDSPQEESEWRSDFCYRLKSHIRDNRRRRAMSEMKAKTDVRFG